MNRPMRKVVPILPLLAVLLAPSPAHPSELLTFDDSTQGILACGHITSGNSTGWDDGTVYVGDVGGTRFHLLVAIRDTAALQSYLDQAQVDSARLSIYIASKFGTPGDLELHFIRRDSTGRGVYPAYNDNLLSHCRSTWIKREGADPSACPDSILWQTAGATGALDSDPDPFVSLSSPSSGARHDIDVTAWIDGLVRHVDSVSNGIVIRTSTADGAGSDFFSMRNIHPFFAGDDRLHLNIWYSAIEPRRPHRAHLDHPAALK